MSYWGKIDKRSIVVILDSGLGFLKDELKDPSRSGNRNKEDFYRLEKLLYGQGEKLLSITNKVRFEKRLNTIRKNLDKFEWIRLTKQQTQEER